LAPLEILTYRRNKIIFTNKSTDRDFALRLWEGFDL